jgi:hypothetical protein
MRNAGDMSTYGITEMSKVMSNGYVDRHFLIDLDVVV